MKILTNESLYLISGGLPREMSERGSYKIGNIIIARVGGSYKVLENGMIFTDQSYLGIEQGAIINGYQIIFMPDHSLANTTTYVLTPVS